jgi:YVTN family beta-propeller protein
VTGTGAHPKPVRAGLAARVQNVAGVSRATALRPSHWAAWLLSVVLCLGPIAGCTSAAQHPPAHLPSDKDARDAVAGPASASPSAAPNVYRHIAPGMMNPKWADDPYRVYVPDSLSNTVTEINPRTYRVIRTIAAGPEPNHVTPSWDGSVLWVNDTGGGTLTPVSPRSGRPGQPVPVADPYNLYFTPDGSNAMVMAEGLSRIDFRNPHTMRLRHSMPVPCQGVNHLDFTADGRHAVASCEFSAQLLWIDIKARKVEKTLTLGKAMSSPMAPPGPGYSMPQDVRLSANGNLVYVADMAANGIWLIDARRFRVIRFRHTGRGTHGFIVGRNGRYLYISNRAEGSISVLDMATSTLIHKWWIRGGGSPDMGGISPDGTVMWWSGRYNDVVYAMSTSDGHLLATIPAGPGPHGLCVFPQPGRYSLGHTGNFR